MKSVLVFLVLSIISTTAIAADAALVIRDDGYYLLLPDSNELVKVGVTIDQRTSSETPLPDVPTTPQEKPSTRATTIGQLSQDVGTREEAVALATVVRSLADKGVSGQAAWNTVFKITLNRVSGSVSQSWEEWKTKVDKLSTDDYSSQFFYDVGTGISTAHSIDTALVKSAVAGDTDVDLGLEQNEIKVLDLMELIQMILELLKELGIFDNSSQAFLPPIKFNPLIRV